MQIIDKNASRRRAKFFWKIFLFGLNCDHFLHCIEIIIISAKRRNFLKITCVRFSRSYKLQFGRNVELDEIATLIKAVAKFWVRTTIQGSESGSIFLDPQRNVGYMCHAPFGVPGNREKAMREKPKQKIRPSFFRHDLQTFIPVPQTWRYFVWIRNEIWAIYAMLRLEFPAIAEKILILESYLVE